MRCNAACEHPCWTYRARVLLLSALWRDQQPPASKKKASAASAPAPFAAFPSPKCPRAARRTSARGATPYPKILPLESHFGCLAREEGRAMRRRKGGGRRPRHEMKSKARSLCSPLSLPTHTRYEQSTTYYFILVPGRTASLRTRARARSSTGPQKLGFPSPCFFFPRSSHPPPSHAHRLASA